MSYASGAALLSPGEPVQMKRGDGEFRGGSRVEVDAEEKKRRRDDRANVDGAVITDEMRADGDAAAAEEREASEGHARARAEQEAADAKDAETRQRRLDAAKEETLTQAESGYVKQVQTALHGLDREAVRLRTDADDLAAGAGRPDTISGRAAALHGQIVAVQAVLAAGKKTSRGMLARPKVSPRRQALAELDRRYGETRRQVGRALRHAQDALGELSASDSLRFAGQTLAARQWLATTEKAFDGLPGGI